MAHALKLAADCGCASGWPVATLLQRAYMETAATEPLASDHADVEVVSAAELVLAENRR